MEKEIKKLIGIAAAMCGWNLYRDRKYPIAKELRFMNKFFVPGSVLTRKMASFGNKTMRKMKNPKLPKGIKKETRWISSVGNSPVRMTIYTPEIGEEKLPCLVYYHGGGFCFSDAWYIHEHVAEYANRARCKVAFVHYRTSDKVAFPVPFQDCCAGLQYIWDQAEELGVDRSRIAVGGDSAGGALAASCSLWARDEARIPLCFQMLIYPVTDNRMQTESMEKYVDCPCWNSGLNKKMWKIYLRKGLSHPVQYAAPMRAETLENLPDAYVEVEEFDCLHDEGMAYAKALRKAGCCVQINDVKGAFHGFDVFQKAKVVKHVMAIRCATLHQAFWQ